MSTIKQRIIENLNHFPELDCEDSSPNGTYSIIAWDGTSVKLLSIPDVASKAFIEETIKCLTLEATTIKPTIPDYADNASALAGGLAVGQLYSITTTGVVMVVLPAA